MPSEASFPKKERDDCGDKFILGSWVPPPPEKRKKSKVVPVGDILSWLDKCIKECQADNVRWFLKQFQSYIRYEILQERKADMTEEAIIRIALCDSRNLETALRVANVGQKIKEEVLKRFLSRVKGEMEQIRQPLGPEWQVQSNWPGGDWTINTTTANLPILLRKNAWPDMVGVAIQAEFPGPKGVAIGIMAPTQEGWKNQQKLRDQTYGVPGDHIGNLITPKDRSGLDALVKNKEERNEWWVCYKQIRENDWTGITTIVKLHDPDNSASILKEIGKRVGELAKEMQEVALSFNEN
jgi:hypothetical protein